MTTPDAESAARSLAQKHLNVESLETQNSDSLDFHEVAVWDIKTALEEAFLLGYNARQARKSKGNRV